MSQSSTRKPNTENEGGPATSEAFARSETKKSSALQNDRVHSLGKGRVCGTGSRGQKRPQGRSRLDIVVEATEGFVPLWAAGTTLRWRFNEPSMQTFKRPEQAKAELRAQFAEALLAWGDAVPVKFTENKDLWDFEIVMSAGDNCNAIGCTLARAFFPDSGRHDLMLFPKMFEQNRQEQVETWIHELGHVFGLRHFFATVDETAWPAEVFGEHNKFSIMNYGELSTLTDADKRDLKRLYEEAWSGALLHINGTPIQFVLPYHTFAPGPVSTVSQGSRPTALREREGYYQISRP